MLEVSPSIWSLISSWLTPTVLFLFLNIMIGTIAITSSLASQKPNHSHEHHPHHQQDDTTKQHYDQQLQRSPSVLQRLKSINLYSYRSTEPQISTVAAPAHDSDRSQFFGYIQPPELVQTPPQQPQLARSPSVLQRLKSFNPYNYIQHAPEEQQRDEQAPEIKLSRKQTEEEEEKTLDEIYNKLQSSNSKVVGRSMSDTKPVGGEIPKKLNKKMKKSASTKSAFGHFEEAKIVEARRPATVREQKSKKEDDEEGEGSEEAGCVDAKADDFINKFKQQLKLQRLDSIIRYKDMVGRGSAR